MKFTKAYHIFTFPALFLHELAHLVVCLLTFTSVFNFKINLIRGEVRYVTPKSELVNFLINLAPLFNFFVAIVLCLVSVYGFIFLAYLTLSYKVSLPSEIDYQNIRDFGKVKALDVN